MEQQKVTSGTTVYTSQGKPQGWNISKAQCYNCKDFSRITNQCNKKFCTYCKDTGCINIDVESDLEIATIMHIMRLLLLRLLHLCLPSPPLRMPTIFALGFTGKSHPSSPVRHLNFGASNHKTSSSANITNVHKYIGDFQIHTADGEHLQIVAIG